MVLVSLGMAPIIAPRRGDTSSRHVDEASPLGVKDADVRPPMSALMLTRCGQIPVLYAAKCRFVTRARVTKRKFACVT